MKKLILFLFFLSFFFTQNIFSASESKHSLATHGSIYFNCDDEALKKHAEQNVCVTAKILPSSDITYFQALKAIYPDLQSDGKASTRAAIRVEIQGMDESAKPGEIIPASQNQSFDLNGNSRTFLHYSLAQRKDSSQLILLSDGGGDRPVLALFQLTSQLKLLDLIDVDFDRWLSMGKFLFDVRENSPLFILTAAHNNSSQSYALSSLWIILHDKLHQIYDGPNLSGERSPIQAHCRTNAELKKIDRLQTQHEGFWDIQLQLSRSKYCEDKKTGQEKKVSEKIYPAFLTWDAQKQKYMGGSKAFVKDDPFQP